MFFEKDKKGLHVAPLSEMSNGACLLSAVEENKKSRSKRQVAGAEKAGKAIAYPSIRDHTHGIRSNQIKKCQVTPEDIKIWLKMCGDCVHAPKGKCTRKKPRAVSNDHIEIPKEFMETHKGLVPFVDILHVDGVTFLLTLCKSIRLIAIWHIKDRKEVSPLEAVDDAFIHCNEAGFETKEFYTDNE